MIMTNAPETPAGLRRTTQSLPVLSLSGTFERAISWRYSQHTGCVVFAGGSLVAPACTYTYVHTHIGPQHQPARLQFQRNFARHCVHSGPFIQHILSHGTAEGYVCVPTNPSVNARDYSDVATSALLSPGSGRPLLAAQHLYTLTRGLTNATIQVRSLPLIPL